MEPDVFFSFTKERGAKGRGGQRFVRLVSGAHVRSFEHADPIRSRFCASPHARSRLSEKTSRFQSSRAIGKD